MSPWILFPRLVAACVFAAFCGISLASDAAEPDAAGREFFEKRVRPVLVEHCYKCHSEGAKELKGELRLDLKAGWEAGGESGSPAIVPGKPDESPLIRAVRHDDDVSAMPPNQSRLSSAIIADLAAWISMGAPDPRDGKLVKREAKTDWETTYQRRLDWWSLKPVANAAVPPLSEAARQAGWARNEVDRFILARLEAQGLKPAPEADRAALARRLSFALTGLPPKPEIVARFAADNSADPYGLLVDSLLNSPHFGERWARHWMDVVHYSDTHGYEWDVPAKNAWRYRDYLIRAFNADLPYRQLILEHIAGDLVEPRVDAANGLVESLIGPMALRLGERYHGDSAGAEGVSQEAVSNMIDTIGKAFLGTTLACAQCHDHKLDAIEQRDYYSLAGALLSTRFSPRTVDAIDPNTAVIDELASIKKQLRKELARLWLEATDVEKSAVVIDKIKAIPADEKPAAAFPTSLAALWKRSLVTPITAEQFQEERNRRTAANKANLKLLADFTREDGAPGWRWDGFGMKHGLVTDGELVVADEGGAALQHLLPAGRYSHVWSQRLAGLLQSPHFDSQKPATFSVEMLSGKFASQSFIVDRALHSERLKFPSIATPGWSTLTAGNFDTLEGSIDRVDRLVYLELATKSLNNYFPPRVGYNGASEAEVADPRSWFGATRIFAHAAGQAPQDELGRFEPLFGGLANETDWARRLTRLLHGAVERWLTGPCTSEDVALLNEALQLKLLPGELAGSAEVAKLVDQYRATEKKLQPDRVVGSAADWNEARDERLAIRGSFTDYGDPIPRGGVRLFGGPPARATAAATGRLELAHTIVDERNPLTARVYVNRVWHYLFGAGLVRTPDDFGHLGEQPTHPELLDYLAQRFMAEGWSTKKLVRLLVNSAAWRQTSVPDPSAVVVDPDNRLWHHLPMRRLEAESIRDALLAVSGRLDPALFGPPIDPFRAAEDTQKRLFRGPLDGLGRRSLYIKMTLMEPPRLLALFNQPIPKDTVGRRDVTNVPDQALALLNDPFVIALAAHWSKQLVADQASTPEERAQRMLAAALSRAPKPEETERLVKFVERSAALRGADPKTNLQCQGAWQDAAHAIFNLKEFIYVP